MKFGIYGNSDNSKALSIISSFSEFLEKEDINHTIDDKLRAYLPRIKNEGRFENILDIIPSADIIYCFGGDGTLLQLGRTIGAAQTPVLSVNLGKLGFLAEISPEEIEKTSLEIIEKRYSLERRIVLNAEIDRKDYFAVNDIVLDRGIFPRTIKIIVNIDGQYFNTYVSDGLIIATPTGSTAYSLSAGGPIIYPELHNILINPICPHSLTARAMIFPDDVEIELIFESDEAEKIPIYMDSQVCINVKKGESVKIRRAEFNFNLVQIKKETFYQVLRKKLNWGEEIRR